MVSWTLQHAQLPTGNRTCTFILQESEGSRCSVCSSRAASATPPICMHQYLMPVRGKISKSVPASSGIGLAPAKGKDCHHLRQTPINHCRPGQGQFEGEAWKSKRATATSSPSAVPHLQESPAECQGPGTIAHRPAFLPNADQDHLQQEEAKMMMLPTSVIPSCRSEAGHP